MKEFTTTDIRNGRIYADRSELVYDPPAWMKNGLVESATGYGARLNSGLKIHYNGRLYRVYITIYSNNGTAWFKANGEKIIVS